jgi:hypothetical protein
MHWPLKNLCKVELLQIFNCLFICFLFFDFSKVTQKKNCGKMHAFDSQKKHKFQVILHFFHKISENLLPKKKSKHCATLHFPFSRGNIITLDFLGGIPTSFPCPRTTQPCHDMAIP